jgi:hypothetical protein
MKRRQTAGKCMCKISWFLRLPPLVISSNNKLTPAWFEKNPGIRYNFIPKMASARN